MAIDSAKPRLPNAVLVFRKCSKTLAGGFSREGYRPLKKALRKYLGLNHDRRCLPVTISDGTGR